MEPSSGGIAFALNHATLEGKITISILLVFSLVSWTVIINKFRQLGRAKRRNRSFLETYAKAKGPLDVFSKGIQKKLTGSPLYDVYMTGCEELQAQLKRYGSKIPLHGMSSVRIAIERGMGESAVNLESGMIILATAISGGPFIGLLGTVWGVMDTFSGIARVQQASLTAMAPGVAAALIATVFGLVVAIPSLFCYNFLVTKAKHITVEMDNFAAHLETVFVAEYMAHKSNGDQVDDLDAFMGSRTPADVGASKGATAH